MGWRKLDTRTEVCKLLFLHRRDVQHQRRVWTTILEILLVHMDLVIGFSITMRTVPNEMRILVLSPLTKVAPSPWNNSLDTTLLQDRQDDFRDGSWVFHYDTAEANLQRWMTSLKEFIYIM